MKLKIQHITGISIAALLLCLIMYGCSKKPAPKVTLVYYVYGQAEMLDRWKEVCRDFESENPDICVIVRHVAGYNDYFSKLLTLIAANTPPDVVFMSAPQIPAYASRGVLLPFDLKNQNEMDQYYPEARKLFTYQNRLWALPNDLAIYVLYYNPSLFDRMNVPYPTDEWDWADFLLAARKLTVFDEDGKVIQFGFARSNPLFWIWQNGGDIVDNPLEPQKATMTTSQVVQALQYLNQLQIRYHAVPAFSSQKEMDIEQMFRSGKVAMIIGGHWWLQRLSETGKPLGIAVLPRQKARATYCSGSGFSVIAQSKHPEEAKKLARFLASTKAQQKLTSMNFGFPARKDMAESHEFLNSIRGVDKQAFLKSVPYLHSLPNTPAFNEMDSLIWRELEWIWTGQKEVKEVCESLDMKIDMILKKNRK